MGSLESVGFSRAPRHRALEANPPIAGEGRPLTRQGTGGALVSEGGIRSGSNRLPRYVEPGSRHPTQRLESRGVGRSKSQQHHSTSKRFDLQKPRDDLVSGGTVYPQGSGVLQRLLRQRQAGSVPGVDRRRQDSMRRIPARILRGRTGRGQPQPSRPTATTACASGLWPATSSLRGAAAISLRRSTAISLRRSTSVSLRSFATAVSLWSSATAVSLRSFATAVSLWSSATAVSLWSSATAVSLWSSATKCPPKPLRSTAVAAWCSTTKPICGAASLHPSAAHPDPTAASRADASASTHPEPSSSGRALCAPPTHAVGPTHGLAARALRRTVLGRLRPWGRPVPKPWWRTKSLRAQHA